MSDFLNKLNIYSRLKKEHQKVMDSHNSEDETNALRIRTLHRASESARVGLYHYLQGVCLANSLKHHDIEGLSNSEISQHEVDYSFLSSSISQILTNQENPYAFFIEEIKKACLNEDPNFDFDGNNVILEFEYVDSLSFLATSTPFRGETEHIEGNLFLKDLMHN